jgi:hypothetical protein
MVIVVFIVIMVLAKIVKSSGWKLFFGGEGGKSDFKDTYSNRKDCQGRFQGLLKEYYGTVVIYVDSLLLLFWLLWLLQMLKYYCQYCNYVYKV